MYNRHLFKSGKKKIEQAKKALTEGNILSLFLMQVSQQLMQTIVIHLHGSVICSVVLRYHCFRGYQGSLPIILQTLPLGPSPLSITKHVPFVLMENYSKV